MSLLLRWCAVLIMESALACVVVAIGAAVLILLGAAAWVCVSCVRLVWR
jgi:hypothetical protein